MRRPVFATLSQLARVRGLDVRNQQLRELSPAAFLLAGGKRFALFEVELSGADFAETSDLNNLVRPPQAIV